MLIQHPLFGLLVDRFQSPTLAHDFPSQGFVRLVLRRDHHGRLARRIEANLWRRAAPEEWANVLGQAVLHIYLNHADPARREPSWHTACQLLAGDLLRQLAIGRRPECLAYAEMPFQLRGVAEAEGFLRDDPGLLRRAGHGIAGPGAPLWTVEGKAPVLTDDLRREASDTFARAIRQSARGAIETAGVAARAAGSTAACDPNSLAGQARRWFVASYPLLGALAASFEIVEDEKACTAMGIDIAAVFPEARKIYINPRFPWTYGGMQFVIAHELLHVGLAHEPRRQGRHPLIWNVACDYVINGWLVEMGIGEMPTDCLLLDPELEFERESAEAIYDRIVGDIRLMRRLNKARTLRGLGKVDVLGERPPGWWNGPGVDLDSFYRRALKDGLDLHLGSPGRGTLPGELVQEIRSLQHPPIPWDVRLGQWLDAFFPPLERRRSFARASRRQAASPDIPRPVWIRPEELRSARTFGVVLDTSGSMPPRLLATALGAIASYAMSREVPQVRVLQCDAGVHDMGYVEPERLLDRVEVRGRGGTVLQPAIARLEGDKGFPDDAPILVITDGKCDVLSIRREHAFLMPEGARLPFRPRGPQFCFEPPGRGQNAVAVRSTSALRKLAQVT